VAHLKREIRQQFEFVLNGALNGGVEKSSKLESLGALSCGLNKACDSLQKLLDIAPNVPVSRVRKPVDYGGYIDLQLRSIADSVRGERDRNLNVIERKYPRTVDRLLQVPAHRYLPGYAIVQKENSAPYVADRIAKLLLELLWRSAAVCEVRPGAGALPPNAARSSGLITSIVLQFTQVDSVLTKALQLASSRRISMSELQYHLTQLHLLDNIIQGELDEQDVDRQFFVKSTEWLEKQIEKLRSLSEIEACRLAHPELFGQDEDRDEGDDVSSRWQGSDAGSVEQLLEGELFFRDEEDEDVDLSGDKNKDKDGDNGQ
jgi:acetolactate synthase regulatory subunit